MFKRVFLGLALAGLVLATFTTLRPREPAPELIQLAVRATLHAMPTATPYVVEVTRVVEVTPSWTPAPTVTSTPTSTPSPTVTATAASSSASTEMTPQPLSVSASLHQAPVPAEAGPADVVPTEAAQPEAAGLPAVPVDDGGCPAPSANSYTLIPVAGAGIEHPDHLHGDLNLSLRGYNATDARAQLVSINGPTDADPPQLNTVLRTGASSALSATYRVNRWDWGCGEHGCRQSEPVPAAVSLLGFAAPQGEPVFVPSRNAQIYGGGYIALVLYAETTRLTVVYTREDSVANGYTVHFENLCVDPELVAMYRAANEAGRRNLPALRRDDTVGLAGQSELLVAVRDRGTFGDPRSRKDWWQSGG